MNWTEIKNEYISTNISYRKLAEKHGISFSTLTKRAMEERWTDDKKAQRKRIEKKIQQKTAEKIAKQEADRFERIATAADKLLEKIEQATQELDCYLTKDKRKYAQVVTDKKTGKPVTVFIEEEVPRMVKLDRIDKAGLRQIANTLKELRAIQIGGKDDAEQNAPSININITAATPDDMEGDEE